METDGKSFMYMMKKKGPKILPWGTPVEIFKLDIEIMYELLPAI